MDYPHHFYLTSKEFRLHVRPIKPSDKELVQKGFKELSIRSKYLRFFALRNKLSDSQLKYFTEVDGFNHVAWGILDVSQEDHKPVGIGRFVKLKNEHDTAEVVITVVDSYQKKGMGRILFAVLNIVAAHVGVEKLRYSVLTENYFVLRALERFGILKQVIEGQVIIVDTKVLTNHMVNSEFPEIQSFIATMKKTKESMTTQLNDNQKKRLT